MDAAEGDEEDEEVIISENVEESEEALEPDDLERENGAGLSVDAVIIVRGPYHLNISTKHKSHTHTRVTSHKRFSMPQGEDSPQHPTIITDTN